MDYAGPLAEASMSLADPRRPIRAGLLAGVILTIFSTTMHAAIPALVTIFLWGVLAFAIVPPLQILIVDRASDAPNLASTLNQGAFNLGNATGAWLGGMAIGAGMPLTSLPWVGVLMACGAFGLTLLSASLDRRARRLAIGQAA